MDYPRHRRLPSVVDARHGTCQGPGSRDAAEHGRHDIGYALPYQLGV